MVLNKQNVASPKEQYQFLLLTQKIIWYFFFNRGIKVTKFKCSLSL